MLFNIEVNNREIQSSKGETILNALRRNGIKVPTLCNMKEFTPTGACRMCIVEVEGKDHLIPSCSHPVEEWMKIKTHSPRVLKARKTIVELLLSNHPDDCLYCERNGNCELQKLAEDLNVRERRIPGSKSKHKIDKSGISVIRDPAKCILCGRCVRICEERQAATTLGFTKRGSDLLIATAMNKPLNFSNCINCGQCIMYCPTGALTEKIEYADLDRILDDKKKTTVAHYSSTISASIAEEFSLKNGSDTNGIINAALRKIGFDKVFETSFAADMLIIEQAEEFLKRYEKGENLPLITSCCPAWVKFAEQSYPELLDKLSTVKSPQQIMGSAIRSYFTSESEVKAEDIFSVSIMPCTAKKYEAQKVEMTRKGLPDIDTVLTVREFVRLIKLHGIDMDHLEPEPADEPMGTMSSAGKLFGASGGALEALMRTVYYRLSGKELESFRMNKLRSSRGLKEMTLRFGKKEIHIAAVSGMVAAMNLLEAIKSGKKSYHVIEIMACPGGCVNGGGQPVHHEEANIKNRAKALYDFDNRDMIKVAHKNPQVLRAYDKYYEKPGSAKCLQELHTRFSVKEVLL
jgi:iron-only hydrogenase group A